jgi:hypothetical protein
MTAMDEAAELARWHHGRQTIPEWLASGPDPDKVRASLVRALDRPDRGGALGRALAAYLGADLDTLYAERHPRRAANLAADCRARGDHPHADKLHAELIALMFCANCGRPLTDPESIDRGIGPDCWPRIDPGWRAAIESRTRPRPGPARSNGPPSPHDSAALPHMRTGRFATGRTTS